MTCHSGVYQNLTFHFHKAQSICCGLIRKFYKLKQQVYGFKCPFACFIPMILAIDTMGGDYASYSSVQEIRKAIKHGNLGVSQSCRSRPEKQPARHQKNTCSTIGMSFTLKQLLSLLKSEVFQLNHQLFSHQHEGNWSIQESLTQTSSFL